MCGLLPRLAFPASGATTCCNAPVASIRDSKGQKLMIDEDDEQDDWEDEEDDEDDDDAYRDAYDDHEFDDDDDNDFEDE
jgi:hypothetical protein